MVNSIELNQSNKTNTITNKMNFAYSFRPVYYFSRMFGLLPFSIVYDSNGDVLRARVTAIDILWFIISVCIYLLLAFLSYTNMRLPDGPIESPLLIASDYTLLIVGLIYGAVIIVFDMYNRSTFIDILKKFTAFDMEVNRITVILKER